MIGNAMKRIWTIIGAADVPLSLKWYQSLLGLAETAHSPTGWKKNRTSIPTQIGRAHV